MDLQARRQQLLHRLARLERKATGNLGKEILDKLVDRKKIFTLMKLIRGNAPLEDMLQNIRIKFIQLFDQPNNVEEALNRFNNLLEASNPIPDRIRNDLGKIADQLGISTHGFLF